MNGQQRSSGRGKPVERVYLEKVEVIENYGGYKRIIFTRPYSNTYMGFLDDDFFGFVIKENNLNLWLMDAKKAVDYYESSVFFHNPVLEYDTFYRKDEFRPHINALKMVKDKQNGN